MVRNINVAVDDALHERADAVKEAHDLTWPEFLEWAVNELEQADTEERDVE